MSQGRQKTSRECETSCINTFFVCVAIFLTMAVGSYNYCEWCKGEAAIKAGLHWGKVEGSGVGFGNPVQFGWVKPKVNDSEE